MKHAGTGFIWRTLREASVPSSDDQSSFPAHCDEKRFQPVPDMNHVNADRHSLMRAQSTIRLCIRTFRISHQTECVANHTRFPAHALRCK